MSDESEYWPHDIFGRAAKEGDFVAAGMTYDRSSVLRVGQIVRINQQLDWDKKPNGRFSVRIRWRNNGDRENKYSWGSVKDSSIMYDEKYRLAKFMIIEKNFVEQFPPDIEDF